MIFKRRDKLPFGQRLRGLFWPKRGWSRAITYLRLRMNRIPDTPDRISRGVVAGVLASFTPLFGFHFVVAAAIAWVLRGNVIAALLGTFAGNPLTFPFIAVASMEIGRRILGHGHTNTDGDSLMRMFGQAASNLWDNFLAIFTSAPTHWHGLQSFLDGVFVPYLVGGAIVGCLCAIPCYLIVRSVIAAYQVSRRARLRARLEAARRDLSPEEPR